MADFKSVSLPSALCTSLCPFYILIHQQSRALTLWRIAFVIRRYAWKGLLCPGGPSMNRAAGGGTRPFAQDTPFISRRNRSFVPRVRFHSNHCPFNILNSSENAWVRFGNLKKKGFVQGRIYIWASMGCNPGTPILEGPASSKQWIFVL